MVQNLNLGLPSLFLMTKSIHILSMVGHVIRNSQDGPQEFIITNNNELKGSMLSVSFLDMTQPCIPFFLPFLSPFLLPPFLFYLFPTFFSISFLPVIPFFRHSSFPFSLSALFLLVIICSISSYHILKIILFIKLSFNLGIHNIMPVP